MNCSISIDLIYIIMIYMYCMIIYMYCMMIYTWLYFWTSFLTICVFIFQEGEAKDYQLWIVSGKDDSAPYPLIGE